MTFLVYLNQRIILHEKLLEFIDDESWTEEKYEVFLNFLKETIRFDDRSEFTEFFRLLSKISKYHHRQPDFKEKLAKILNSLENEIKQTFSNSEIFDIFKSNKLILLILFKNKLISADKIISYYLFSKYSIFFYPEIETFLSETEKTAIEKNLSENDSTFFDKIEEKRQIGENDSIICSLIRNDSIDEFVKYVNFHNIQFDSRIKPSIYETHSFLIKKKNPTLIEYASFFGSIQIFQYLKTNGAKLKPSLWLYSIHSNNAEMIQILEDNDVKKPDINKAHDLDQYTACLCESIKCHHNQIADYFKDNFVNQSLLTSSIEPITQAALCYHNYKYYQYSSYEGYDFYYLYRYDYTKLVNYFLEVKRNDIEKQMILKINFFSIKFKNFIFLIIFIKILFFFK